MKVSPKAIAIVRVILLVVLTALMSFVAFGRPVSDSIAAPMEQQATDEVWFDKTVTPTGVTAVIESGVAGTWAAFLHIDAPAAADSYTMTIGGRAIIGTTVYTQTLDLVTTSAHEFAIAQNCVISATYSGGRMWPQHFVTVNSRNANLTADLLWLQKR